MKAYKYILIIAVLAGFSACKYEPLTEETAFASNKDAEDLVNSDNGTVYSIEEFLTTFMSGHGDLFPVKERAFADSAQTNYIYSVDTIPVGGDGIYIRGRICNDDKEGNFYKTLILQDLSGTTAGDTVQHCLQIMIDGSSICGIYPIGQEVLIRCNGLAVGKSYGQPQLCVPTYKNYEFEAQYQYPGWTAGRIPVARFNNATMRIGVPDKKKIYYEPITPSEYYNLNKNINWTTSTIESDSLALMNIMLNGNKMVRFENASFTQDCISTTSAKKMTLKPCVNADDNPDATPETEILNVFYSNEKNSMGWANAYDRAVANTTDTIALKTTEYCNFAHYLLPAKEYKGVIRGFWSYYVSNATKSDNMRVRGCWSLTMTSLDDIVMFKDEEGVKKRWEPKEWEPSL